MKKFNFKKELYNDLRKAKEEIRSLENAVIDKEKKLTEKWEKTEYFKDNLENVYYTLKTIKELTEDKTIETICVLKMQDIKNMSGIYIGEE
jgi:hypothetical protein